MCYNLLMWAGKEGEACASLSWGAEGSYCYMPAVPASVLR